MKFIYNCSTHAIKTNGKEPQRVYILLIGVTRLHYPAAFVLFARQPARHLRPPGLCLAKSRRIEYTSPTFVCDKDQIMTSIKTPEGGRLWIPVFSLLLAAFIFVTTEVLPSGCCRKLPRILAEPRLSSDF